MISAVNYLFEKLNQAYVADDSQFDSLDFNILVLSAGSWPLTAPTTAFNIPEDVRRIFFRAVLVQDIIIFNIIAYLQVVKTYDRFQKFYQSKHSGRKLNWLFQLSKAELKATCFKASKTGYTLQVTFTFISISQDLLHVYGIDTESVNRFPRTKWVFFCNTITGIPIPLKNSEMLPIWPWKQLFLRSVFS